MKETKTVLAPYQDTDFYISVLEKNGDKIICVSYGYTSFYDLIIYEREVTQNGKF